ncbi:cytochrome c maturase subunit B [Tanacetum coccineum]
MVKLILKIIQDTKLNGDTISQVSKDVADVLLNDKSEKLTDELIYDNMIDLMIPREDSVPLPNDDDQEENLEMKRHKEDLGDPLCWDDYLSFPFTRSAIKETLRTGNIVMGVIRKAIKDMEIKGPTEATFLSALFKRLASARKRRQGHKVSEVASLSQEGPIRIPPLFPFPSAPFPRNEKEDGTLELYYLSAYCLPKILLLQLVGHRVIQISRVFRGFPMLQLPYQFGRSGMDRLNIPLGSLVLTFLCGIHSRSALGITSSSGGNSSQNPTTSPTSLPLTLSRTSIETEWFHVLSPIGYSFPFVSLSPISVSISSQD